MEFFEEFIFCNIRNFLILLLYIYQYINNIILKDELYLNMIYK